MRAVLTVRLGIAHLDLQEALRDAVHLLDLCSPRQAGCALQSIVEQLTVCSRPPRRGSSKTLLRAKGETVVMDWQGGGGGCRSSWAVARLLRLDLGSALSGTIAVDACARNQMKSIACLRLRKVYTLRSISCKGEHRYIDEDE